ncbi:PQQ-binding-like beta-propeller repeat protein [Paraglaciecola sp. L3A3]|uniref:outer membrane protein assembly factor BamB family protein n=1 Tax=Paraglaciecola sp. L3A3 TaxID=2686358 RepID=UPI00131B56EF|nr:PQQ-binding-like beta-propeller repeat protein [Paraglaciecola sp. L3A3]
MKYNSRTLSPLLLISFLNFFSINVAAQTINIQEQWPMFGGPNGNGQVTTHNQLKNEWSVRTGKNIKWQVELPAGGQSGITVWQDQVFFTINRPLDTPALNKLEAQHQTAKLAYETEYTATITDLKQKNDKKLNELNLLVNKTANEWNKLIKERQVQKLAELNYRAKLKNPQWLALTKNKTDKLNYIFSQNKTLMTMYESLTQAENSLQQKGMGSDIILYSLNAITGTVQWQRTVKGTVEAMYNYTFSDATSPSPATDGKHVWVVNSAGGMAAFTMQGKPIWSRTFEPSKDAPFNKQYDTILYRKMIFNVEPKAQDDNSRIDNWNYLHAFDVKTGKRLWVSEDALTHYSTPVFSYTKEGIPAIMIGRGGPHDVPEKPEGLSLVDLRPATAGKSLWQWQAPHSTKPFGGTEIQNWNTNTAFWQQGFDFKTFEIYQLDSSSGKFKTKQNLHELSRYQFDLNLQDYVLQQNPNLQGHWDRQPYTQVVLNNKLYYMVRYQPYIAMHDLITGENTLLEIPTEVKREKGKTEQYVWKTMQTTDQLNSRGQRHNPEPRAQGDGTQKSFLGSPIVVNNKIFFTNAHGLTYVIDANVPFDPNALIAVNDIGQAGETVSLNAMAYSNGKLFHRSLKSIVCIE